MANIPLTDIPNAPQEVFTPTADPRYSGDQVGGQAQQDIREGYSSNLQDPTKAGAIGQAVAGLGDAIIKGGTGVADAVGLNAISDQRKQLEEAQNTGYIQLTKNRLSIQQNFDQVSAGQPVAMYPKIWNDVAGGADGKNFYVGMSPIEQAVMTHHVMDANYTGMAHYSNLAYARDFDQKAADSQLTYTQLFNSGDYDGAAKISASRTALGYQSKAEEIANTRNLSVAKDQKGISQSLNDYMIAFQNGKATDPVPPLLTQMKDLASQGQGLGNMDAEAVKKTAHIGQAIVDQGMWKMSANIFNDIQTGTITDPQALRSKYPFLQNMPKEIQDGVYATLTNEREGTPLGNAATKAAQIAVNSFPNGPSWDTKEPLDLVSMIHQTVPASQQGFLLSQLDAKQKERVNNGGNLKPETELTQYGNDKVKSILESQTLGVYNPKILENTKEHNYSQAQINETLDSLSRAEQINNLIKKSGATNQFQVDKIILEHTDAYRKWKAAQGK